MTAKSNDVSRLAENLVRERELMKERMKDAQEAEKYRILNRREGVNPEESKLPENHDQAA